MGRVKKQPKLVEITDAPYLYLDCEGELDEVIERLSGIKSRLEKAIKDGNYKTPFEDYVKIEIYSAYYENNNLGLKYYRYATKEEIKKEKELQKSLQQRILFEEKRRYEELKKKFES